MQTDILKRLVEAVRKLHPKIVVTYASDKFDPAVCLDGWVTITADEIVVVETRIGKTLKKRVPGFIVEQAVAVPGSHWEPDDVDVVTVAEEVSPFAAVRCAYLTVLEHYLDQSLNSIGEELAYVDVAEESVSA